MSNHYKIVRFRGILPNMEKVRKLRRIEFKSKSSHYKWLQEVREWCDAQVIGVDIHPQYYTHIVYYPTNSMWYEEPALVFCLKQSSR